MGELLAGISSRELSEWMAFYNIEAEDEREAELARQAQAKLNARTKGRHR